MKQQGAGRCAFPEPLHHYVAIPPPTWLIKYASLFIKLPCLVHFIITTTNNKTQSRLYLQDGIAEVGGLLAKRLSVKLHLAVPKELQSQLTREAKKPLLSSCPGNALGSWRSFGRGMQAIWAMWEQLIRKLGKPRGCGSGQCCPYMLLSGPPTVTPKNQLRPREG